MGKFKNHTCRIIGAYASLVKFVCLSDKSYLGARLKWVFGKWQRYVVGSIDSYLGKKADKNCYHSVSDNNGNNLHSDSGSI